jgi:hypothetical protein
VELELRSSRRKWKHNIETNLQEEFGFGSFATEQGKIFPFLNILLNLGSIKCGDFLTR